MRPYDVVVSAENNHAMAWQAMLLHFSLVNNGGRAPIVVVHGDGPLVPGLQILEEHGGHIRRSPNYNNRYGIEYPPRNSVGTLATVDSGADHVVLCDTDMIFVSIPRFENFLYSGKQVTFDRVNYLRINHGNRQILKFMCQQTGVPVSLFERPSIDGGVPHIIPSPRRREIAEEWMLCLDQFLTAHNSPTRPWKSFPWIASMWALVMAIERLNLESALTTFCTSNFRGDTRRRMPSCAIIHYCYGDDGFDKRRYTTEEDSLVHVWKASAHGASVNSEICDHLRAAGRFYGLC